jgi:hypothetical protein
MDVMTRHQTATSGWLFGTYQYNAGRKNADRKNCDAPLALDQ